MTGTTIRAARRTLEAAVFTAVPFTIVLTAVGVAVFAAPIWYHFIESRLAAWSLNARAFVGVMVPWSAVFLPLWFVKAWRHLKTQEQKNARP